MNSTTDIRPMSEKRKLTHQERTALWINPETGIFRRRDMRIGKNSKRFNHLETVYGCASNSRNCPWGCSAKFTCKKLLPDSRTRFDIPVPQILNVDFLREGLRKLVKQFKNLSIKQERERKPFVTMGSMGDPSYYWTGPDGEECTVGAIEIVNEEGVTPVPFSRFWKPPTADERIRLYESKAVIHCTVSALDSDSFLRSRFSEAKKYLSLGGRWVQRVVTMYFDDTTKEGRRLWERQDELMTGRIPEVSDNRARVIENPARLMKGKKEGNPLWNNEVPEWAYFKAPTTADHKFSPHNHNWTAGPLYQGDFTPVQVRACYEGCKTCGVDCMIRIQGGLLCQDTLSGHL